VAVATGLQQQQMESSMKKLVLKRETLKVLTSSEARRVQGGLDDEWTAKVDCSYGGGPCTSGCTRGSRNCWPAR
jgi:hypothetical protein